MSDSEVNMAQIGRLAGVGRAAVVNWRRHHADFPQPVGGTETSPTFRLTDAESWLLAHDKVRDPEPPPEPATVTVAGGATVTLLAPDLTTNALWRDGFEQLGGFITIDAELPWPTVDIERADVPSHAPFAVQRADVDISYAASPTLRYLKLSWPVSRRQELGATAPADAPRTTETDR